MLSKIGYLLFGIFLVIIPIIRFSTGRLSTWWGQPVSPLGDIALFLFGIVLICLSIFKSHSLVKLSLICPKCEKTVEHTGIKEVHCPACGTKMEKLKGFYERHPKLKIDSDSGSEAPSS